MARIYTRTGDQGETNLIDGVRVRKDSARIAACGTVDELNAALGVVRAEGLPPADDAILATVQHQLFALGAELAKPDGSNTVLAQRITSPQIRWLEQVIDRQQAGLPPLSEFIIPGGTRGAAALHWARCVCRRAERLVVQLAAATNLAAEPIQYLNRLSDLLFVLARAANRAAGQPDVPWQKDSAPPRHQAT